MESGNSAAYAWHGVGLTRSNRITEYEKPNEDWHIVDNEHQIYIVLDGVSRTPRAGRSYADPSPAAVVAQLFGSIAHSTLVENRETLAGEIRLRNAAAAANAAVAEYNREMFPEVDYLENNPAGCVGIISLIAGGHFYYAYLGDCSGRILRCSGNTVFTNSQTKAVREHPAIAALSGDERSVCIRRDVCNNPSHECGYGVFNGAPAAMEFLVMSAVPLTGNETIILATDGMDPLFETQNVCLLPSMEPDDLIALAEDYEPRFPGMRSDDKTVVIIRGNGH